MKLTKPISVFGNLVHEITFREPNANDVIKCGFIYTLDKRFDLDAMGRYVTHLGCVPEGDGQAAVQGLPPGSVGQMSPLDFTRAMGEVVGFFSDVNENLTS